MSVRRGTSSSSTSTEDSSSPAAIHRRSLPLSDIVNEPNFRMKCLLIFGVVVLFLFVFFLPPSVGAGLLGSRAWAQADGGTWPNWECAADSASTAALIYLHCSAPAPPLPFSLPHLPPPPFPSLSLSLSLTALSHSRSWREKEGR